LQRLVPRTPHPIIAIEFILVLDDDGSPATVAPLDTVKAAAGQKQMEEKVRMKDITDDDNIGDLMSDLIILLMNYIYLKYCCRLERTFTQ
jgi:hypothetical protein